MKTRAQVVASHCIITRVPVEIITQILKLIPSDLRSVSETCRYLRAIANPLIYQELKVVPKKRTSFAPLEALGGIGKRERAGLLRSLVIGNFEDRSQLLSSARATSFGSIVCSSLSFLTNLTSISLPCPLLTNAVFNAIYDHHFIVTLNIVGEVLGYYIDHKTNISRDLDLRSRVSRPSRNLVLTVPKIVTKLGLEGPRVAKLLATFLLFRSVVVPSITIGFSVALRPNTGALNYPLFPHLTSFTIIALPEAFQQASEHAQAVIKGQTSLNTLKLVLSDAVDGFALDFRSWITWVDDEAARTLPSFDEAWAGVKLSRLETTFLKNDAAEEFITFDVAAKFFPSTVITPERVREMALDVSLAGCLSFWGTDLCWSDWSSTVDILQSNLHSLDILLINGSLTSIPTVNTTLACSQTCYDGLETSHPSLHVASELVGGYLVLWEVLYNLNVGTLQRLGPTLAASEGDLFWMLYGGGRALMVSVEGRASEDGTWATWRDHKLLSTEERVKLCSCFGCGKVEEGKDPLSALRECGVEEVRAALVAAGFDLDAFDSRAPTQPIDQGSFETFLRSNTT